MKGNEKGLYCQRVEFKNKTKKPVLGIILKEDENYIHFKTKKGVYRFSHQSIDSIGETNIEFDGGSSDERD